MIHHTTLAELKKRNCSFLDKLVSALGPDWGENTPIPLTKIIETNGIKDAIWALRANLHPDAEKESRLFACDMAERVLPLFEKQFPLDERPRKAIEISRLFAEGKANKEELGKARDDAAHAAYHANHAAYHASYAADAAAEREKQKKLFLKRFGADLTDEPKHETTPVSANPVGPSPSFNNPTTMLRVTEHTETVTTYMDLDSSCVAEVQSRVGGHTKQLTFHLIRKGADPAPYTYDVDDDALKDCKAVAEAICNKGKPYHNISQDASWGKFHARVKAKFGNGA